MFFGIYTFFQVRIFFSFCIEIVQKNGKHPTKWKVHDVMYYKVLVKCKGDLATHRYKIRTKNILCVKYPQKIHIFLTQNTAEIHTKNISVCKIPPKIHPKCLVECWNGANQVSIVFLSPHRAARKYRHL